MRRPKVRLAAWVAALSPVSLVLSHDLSFLAAYGPGYSAALRATGHDARWTSAVAAVIAVSAVLGVAALSRLLSLWRRARRAERDSRTRARPGWRAYARTVLVIWAPLALATAGWFLAQENLERVSAGLPPAGLEPIVGPGLGGPLLIIPAVSLVVALVGGLFRWGAAALRARIAAAAAAAARPRPARVRVPAAPRLRRSRGLAHNLGLRAPPTPLAA